MLRTYILSFAAMTQGVVGDLPAEQIQQVVVLAEKIADAKEVVLNALSEEDAKNIQFTEQCRELSEGVLFQSPFEGWLN